MKDWLLQFWQKIIKLLPRYVIVKKSQAGVLLFCGKPRKTVGPGIYFLMPIFDDCECLSVISQVIDLPDVPATTKDDKAVLVSAVIVYGISDPEEALYSIYDYDQAIRTQGSAALLQAVSRMRWDERDVGEIAAVVAGELILEVKPHGLDIESVGINSLIRTRSYYLTHHSSVPSTSNGGYKTMGMAGEES